MDESYFNRKIPATNASSAPKICSSTRLFFSSFRYIRAEYKDKVPDVSYPRRNIGTLCNSKLKQSKFRDLCTESIEKLVKMNEFI